MNKEFVTQDIAKELNDLGFTSSCFPDFDKLIPGKFTDRFCSDFYPPPLWQQAIKFIHSKGIFIVIQPELYLDGINWNWQLLWYLPKDQQTEDLIDDGTGMYGDNGEFPTYELAIEAAILKSIEILKSK